MLYTDRYFVTIDDVASLDPSVTETSVVEKIPTEGPSSFVNQAIEETADMLLADFQGFGYFSSVSEQAAFNVIHQYSDQTPPARIKIGQVVVDSDSSKFWSPLKRYVANLALRNFYKIAANRKIDDKYQANMELLDKDLANKHLANLRSIGLPIVFSPIPCPGAVAEPLSGTWDASNVSAVSGGTADASTWDVSITWVTANGESSPSELVTVATDADEVLHVDINSLVAPAGTTSWKIFVGETGAPQFMQASIPIGAKTFTSPITPILSGELVGRGQSPDKRLTFINSFFRG